LYISMPARRNRASAPDGKDPIDGRKARSLDSKRRIVAAIIELVRRGILDPTADQVASETRLSRALVFRYFRDKESLRRPVAVELEEYGRRLMGDPIPASLPLSRRLELLVERQTRMLEKVTPFRRATLVHEPFSKEVTKSQMRARSEARRVLQQVLGPELNDLAHAERRKLLDALHMVLAWPSWETLRRHYGRGEKDARDTISRTVLTIARQALPGLQ
jgi:TetR/AcrR family transcriptional regulator of autoinduction and epiphytic fitness